ARCGGALPTGAASCPVCDAPVEAGRRGADPAPPASREELGRRLAKLSQWAQAARPLGISVPSVPEWAEGFARTGAEPDAWLDVVRGVERIAQQKIVQALEASSRDGRARLERLEAYAVDSRLERESMDDALHAARTGEIARALATYQQVDRVVALKERHLDRAREELERLIGLIQDMGALGLGSPDDPEALAEELERELRRGQLAPLKQRLRDIEGEARAELERGLPRLIARFGDQLVRRRAEGLPIEVETTRLARAARSFARGRPEEAARELRQMVPTRKDPESTAATPAARASSRTAPRPRPRSGGGEHRPS
ncbi:MAG: hypothetical protein ACRECR_05235, partial [Thermoplasmata archaeon]